MTKKMFAVALLAVLAILATVCPTGAFAADYEGKWICFKKELNNKQENFNMIFDEDEKRTPEEKRSYVELHNNGKAYFVTAGRAPKEFDYKFDGGKFSTTIPQELKDDGTHAIEIFFEGDTLNFFFPPLDEKGSSVRWFLRRPENYQARVSPETKPMSVDDFLKLCGGGTPQQVIAAIGTGVDVNAKNSNGWTALVLAAWLNNNPEVISVLIKAGADVNAKDPAGETPLKWAAWGNKNPEVISALIRGGADVNVKSNKGWTPLMWASWHSSPEVLSVLIQAGADVGAKNEDGRTALTFAVEKNGPEVVSLLLASGATVSQNDVELAQKNEKLRGTAVIEALLKAASAGTPETPEVPKAPEKPAPHAFLPKARVALTQFEHFSIEVPNGWSVNDDKANNTVTFTAPGGSAGFTLSVVDGQGAPLERWAHLLMFLKQGQNIAQSGDVYTFEFEAGGAAFRAAVTGGKFVGTMAITGEHNDIGRMIKSLSPSPAINSINFDALYAALAGEAKSAAPAPMEYYTLGNDRITSITKLVGQRKVVKSESTSRHGVTAFMIEYSTDPADHTQAANDVGKYFQHLCANEEFVALKSFDGLPYEGGVEMQFAKDSVDKGNIVILDIEYNSKGYTLLFRKGEGTITRN